MRPGLLAAAVLLSIDLAGSAAAHEQDWTSPKTLRKTAELPYFFDRMKTVAYKKSLQAIMTGPQVQPWARRIIRGGASLAGPGRHAVIGKESFEIYDACTQRMCRAYQLRVIYRPGGKKAWAVQKEEGGKGASGQIIPDEILFFGNPDEPMRKALVASLDQ